MMEVRARELKAGQMIRVEYGDYDNWVEFHVDAVSQDGKYIDVECHAGGIHTTLAMRPEEFVEVVGNA